MIETNINGIGFNSLEGETSDFGCFVEGHEKGTDTAPHGMIQEMKSFIAIQDKFKLRKLLDIGALFGVFSLVFTRYEDAEAFAFEPSETAFDGLIANCRVNENREIYPYREFVGKEDFASVQCGQEWKHLTANRPGDDGKMYTYSEKSLDFMMEHGYFPCPDCVKIDVEGYEANVFRGALNVFTKCRPIIFIEVHFSVLGVVTGDTAKSLLVLIKALDYVVKTFQGETVSDEQFGDKVGCRYILFPKEKA